MKIYITFLFTFFLISFLQANRAVPYTGKLSIDDINFDGKAKFRFEIIDQAGSQLWAHSNSSQSSAIEVTVNGGRYSVLLGGQGMNPLPPKLFLDNPNLFLKVHFDSGDGKGMRHLAPDISISANAFSLASEWSKYAELASGVPSGSITKDMLSSGLRSELDLNNSLKPMGLTNGIVQVAWTGEKRILILYNEDSNSSELLGDIDLPSVHFNHANSYIDGDVFRISDSETNYVNYDLKNRKFLAVTSNYVAEKAKSLGAKGSPYNYRYSRGGSDPFNGIVQVAWTGEKRILILYNEDSNSSELLGDIDLPSVHFNQANSYIDGDVFRISDSETNYVNYDLKNRKFLAVTSNYVAEKAKSLGAKGSPYNYRYSRGGSDPFNGIVQVAWTGEKRILILYNEDSNSSELLGDIDLPSVHFNQANSYIDGDVFRISDSETNYVNYDLKNRKFLAVTSNYVAEKAKSLGAKGSPYNYLYTYEANVGIITKDMLSPALRTELFPPATNDPQINGTLENPYGWDGEVVIGTLDANYTVPAGKVLIITTASQEAFSDGVLFMGSKGNAVIPAGKEVGGIFAGLIVDEVPSITPVLAVNSVGENISLSVPSDKLFVITTGTPVWNTSVSPSSWDFTVDGKTMPLGVGNPAILPAQASIISGIGETYKAGYANRSSEYGFKAGGFSGYLISPEDLKKLR